MDSKKYVSFLIPASLEEAFDDFVILGISSISETVNKDEWNKGQEGEIIDWLEHQKYKKG